MKQISRILLPYQYTPIGRYTSFYDQYCSFVVEIQT